MNFIEDKILSPGEKIKQIRKYLGAKQQDISNGNISRSLISYIESGKTKLVEDTAKIISDNMNNIAKEKNIDIDVTPEYLMEGKDHQCNKLLEKYIDSLKECLSRNSSEFSSKLNKAEEVITQCNLPDKKAQIYDLAGKYFYNKYNNSESYMYYLKSLENNIRTADNNKISRNLLDLSMVCIDKKNYKEAINFNNSAIAIIENKGLSDNLMKRAIFNNAIAYRIINKVDKSLEFLDKLELLDIDLTLPQRIDILILKGNCLCDKKTYKAAKDIYEKALNILPAGKMLDKKALLYRNIYTIYFDVKKYDLASEYILKSFELCEKINSNMMGKILHLMSEFYYVTKENALAEKYGLRGIKYTNNHGDISLKIDMCSILVKIFTNEYMDSKIVEILEELKKIDTTDLGKDDIIKIKDLFMYATNYFIEKDIEKSKWCLEYSMEI